MPGKQMAIDADLNAGVIDDVEARLGVAGIGLRRDWRDDSRWYCSELVAWAIEQGGTPLFRGNRFQRVTQEHLYMLAPA